MKKLTHHPFLLSLNSRVGYCFEVHQAYENDSSENNVFEQFISLQSSQQIQRWKWQFKHFKGWHSRIKCHLIFKEVDENSCGCYVWKVAVFLRFLRNLKVHYITDTEVFDVDRYVRRTLGPRFLSYLHEHHMKKSDR